jgi:[methyl-Co(III) methanol-specific corrinoid protein]:coenzyme M methyltransferase
MAAHEQGSIENVGVPFCMTIEAEGMGAEVDPNDGERAAGDPLCHGTLDRWTGSHLNVTAGSRVCIEAIRMLKDKAPHLPIRQPSGPVSLATSLVDPLLFYRALRRDRRLRTV